MTKFKPAIGAWVLSHLLVGVAYLVARSFPGTSSQPRVDDGLMAWDGGWYVSIANTGYDPAGTDLRFAPLYPILGRLIAFVTGGNTDIGLLLVSNACGLLALVLLTYFAVERTPTSTSWIAPYSMALWPAGFVMTFAYSESLFLVLTIGSALALLKDRWWLTAALGVAAGATRPTGLLLVILLVGISIDKKQHLSKGQLLALSSPGFGLALYLGTSKLVGASFTTPGDIQKPLRGNLVDPVSRLITGIVDFFGRDPFGDGLHLPFTIFGIGATVLVWRRVVRAEAMYTGAIVLLAISAQNWNSLERYLLSAFPIFLVLPSYGKRTHPRLILAASGVAMVAMTVLAWRGAYVP